MYCATCDRWEHSDLGLDLETCMKCRGILCQPDEDDDGGESIDLAEDADNGGRP